MIKAQEIPKFFYKYRSIDNDGFYKTFLEGKLYFASPKDFNDPFDTKIVSDYTSGSDDEIKEWTIKNFMFIGNINHTEAEKEYNKAISEYGIEKIKSIIDINSATRQFLDKEFGICSFSETNVNMPMWAHYSMNHTGFCVEYNANNLNSYINNLYKIRLNNTPIFLNKVIYYDSLPTIDPYSESDTAIVEKQFFAKSADWSYEKEWRIINPYGANVKLNLPKDIITGIYFGLNVLPQNIVLIKDFVNEKLSDISFYKTKMSNATIEFENIQ